MYRGRRHPNRRNNPESQEIEEHTSCWRKLTELERTLISVIFVELSFLLVTSAIALAFFFPWSPWSNSEKCGELCQDEASRGGGSWRQNVLDETRNEEPDENWAEIPDELHYFVTMPPPLLFDEDEGDYGTIDNSITTQIATTSGETVAKTGRTITPSGGTITATGGTRATPVRTTSTTGRSTSTTGRSTSTTGRSTSTTGRSTSTTGRSTSTTGRSTSTTGRSTSTTGTSTSTTGTSTTTTGTSTTTTITTTTTVTTLTTINEKCLREGPPPVAVAFLLYEVDTVWYKCIAAVMSSSLALLNNDQCLFETNDHNRDFKNPEGLRGYMMKIETNKPNTRIQKYIKKIVTFKKLSAMYFDQPYNEVDCWLGQYITSYVTAEKAKAFTWDLWGLSDVNYIWKFKTKTVSVDLKGKEVPSRIHSPLFIVKNNRYYLVGFAANGEIILNIYMGEYKDWLMKL